MLVLMLVSVASLRLCSVARAQPLCRVHTVRTGKVTHDDHASPGNVLYFSSATRLIKHPCKKNIALYLGQQLFFTRNNFESSLPPLSIPTSMQVGIPEVTSAHFAGSLLLLVVNKKVYIYNYRANYWTASTGINYPVSHISGDNCCYSKHPFCLDISNVVFAYLLGDQLSKTNIYYSENWAYRFHEYASVTQEELLGSLGGIFSLHSVSQIGLLFIEQGQAKFEYSDHPLNSSFGLPFDYNGTLDVLIVPGQKGILIFWSEKSLLVSRNSGQLVFPVQVQEGPGTLYSSVLDAGITIHSVAANENGLAVLTREDNLYYGSLGILTSLIVKFPHQNIWSPQAALMFTDLGILEILTPLPDSKFPAFDFQKCSVNIQAVLMDPQLHIDLCKVEVLQGTFDNKMYTIDMNSKLELTAEMIPRPGTSPVPFAMVSNPHSLGLHVYNSEDGYTYDGNTKHRLNISLKQQHHWGRADSNFTSSIKKPTFSTITVDIANKEISCVDLKPLTALISIGCDLKKKIVVQNEISACYKGILDPVALQDNYSYVIEKGAYNLNFQGQKATEDLVVHYPYEKLGCPLLVHYDTPWKPVVELWQGGKFQEVVEAEYVLLEVNGLFTYTYSLTAGTALCSSQPQNWTTIEEDSWGGPFAWDRENYMSCHNPNNDSPLQWPNVPYQILGGPTENKIIFDQRNGIYIFIIYIVDPYYSYCHLTTTFSIYVYGAFPLSILRSEITIVLIMTTILLSVWLAYVIPKWLPTEQGHRFKRSWDGLCDRCRKSCACFQFRR
ncbi:cation channel sperm-associated protein subunit delta [Myotis myotis]|uniref:Cation channel sperm-associated auxiliary subunit delta n=1 Tax=Myotis myotis TaxID=51298 RepID=A0A7J7XE24_MYOMY|nr:cation channel sperm-associated protein subunit delta [Myotis myotis]KAF6347967.1 cation channel sperm associated auxiliary subunit delta [Myotis myotis]